MVLNYLASHGGTASRTLSGYNLSWANGWTIDNALFSVGENEKDQGTIISLTNKRIAEMLQEIPRAHPVQQKNTICTDRIPLDVKGIWSLWLFIVQDEHMQKIFVHPIFQTKDGSNLAMTAATVWEAIARGDFTICQQPLDLQQTIPAVEIEEKNQCEEYLSEIQQSTLVKTVDYFPVLYLNVEGKDA